MEILISVVGSLIGGFILATLPGFSKLISRFPLKKMGIVMILEYSNQKSAQKKMLNDFHKSKSISVLAVKGDTFSSPESPFINEVKDKNKDPRYLISSKDNMHLKTRGKELDMDLEVAVEMSISNFMKRIETNSNISLRFHEEEADTRIIMFDSVIYVSYYEKNMPSRNSPVYRIKKENAFWNTFSSIFEEKWKMYEKSEYKPRGEANGT